MDPNDSYYQYNSSKRTMYPYSTGTEGYEEYRTTTSYPTSTIYSPVDSSYYQTTAGYPPVPTTQYGSMPTATPAFVGYAPTMPTFSIDHTPTILATDYSVPSYHQMGSMPESSPMSPSYSDLPLAGSYSPYELSQDEESGSSERKFQCSYAMCPMRFKRRRDLSRHETSVHRNERMYICDGTLSETDSRLKHCQCGRAFNRKDNLRNHLKPRAGRFSANSHENASQQ